MIFARSNSSINSNSSKLQELWFWSLPSCQRQNTVYPNLLAMLQCDDCAVNFFSCFGEENFAALRASIYDCFPTISMVTSCDHRNFFLS